MEIYSRAPLRLSFAGGGTDVEPYLSTCGGLVLSVTINKYVYTKLRPHAKPWIAAKSLDYGLTTRFAVDAPPLYDGKLDLVKAVLQRSGALPTPQGLELVLRSDVRPGTGLGASSAMAVALGALFKQWLGQPVVAKELAELAYGAERLDLGSLGGKQDQYAAAYGGVNLIEFSGAATTVRPLPVPPAILQTLQRNLLLCYTGATRLSTTIIAAQIENVARQEAEVLGAMADLKALTQTLTTLLLSGRLDEFGTLLHEAWLYKQKLAPTISNPYLDQLYATARRYGALGGKLAGAGGGGYLFFYCPAVRKPVVAAQLARLGARAEPFTFVSHGVQAWTAPAPPGTGRWQEAGVMTETTLTEPIGCPVG